jgi:hypothetical protein
MVVVVYGEFKTTQGDKSMTGSDTNDLPEIKIDQGNLYYEETFTDLKAGWIRRLTPVNPDGTRDKRRESLFIGQTQLVSPEGPIPIQCQIPAKTLPEAMKKFPEFMKMTMKQMIEQAMEMRRQASSRIITP